ncbi:hypothetical protein [Sphingomonas sp. Y38-1Y]|uniref:hypothetical protein n=1 Tax=Sphingomonas sp. Y38-1Y TaxID=3078265 RepID=UPI0028EBE2B8|nr:hypothetical protein [Sphingomonas sp. Y38-1Y]
MTKLIFAAAAAAFVAAPALADERETVFTRDGQTYAYTVAAEGDATVISGRTLPQNDPFRLVVRGRTASGDVDGRAVSFRVAKPLAVAARVQSASVDAN